MVGELDASHRVSPDLQASPYKALRTLGLRLIHHIMGLA